MARILGIDIDRSAVRGAVLKTAFRSVEVERYVQIPLVQAPNTPGRLPELHDAFASMLRALGKPPDFSVSALDGEHASLRVIELPVAARKRVAEVLPFELESLLPFDVEDAVIDHQPIDTQDGQMRLLAAAVLQKRVREHLEPFSNTAFDPREVAVGPAALEALRVLQPELGTGTVAVLVLRERDSDLCVLHNGRTAFARTLSQGAEDVLMDGDELVQSIRRSLAAHRAGGGAPETSLLIAGEGRLGDIAYWLRGELQQEVQVLELPAPEAGSGESPAAFARALALSARAVGSSKRLNLRVGELALAQTSRQLSQYGNLFLICVIASLLSVVFALKAREGTLRDEQEALKKQLSTTTAAIFGKAETNPTKVEELVESPPSEDPLPRFDAYDALAAVSDAIPEEIRHEVRQLRVDLADDKREGQLELQGSLASIVQRDEVVSKLEAHGCFQDIQRGRTSPGRSGDQVNYQIEAKLQCPGDSVAKKRKPKASTTDE